MLWYRKPVPAHNTSKRIVIYTQFFNKLISFFCHLGKKKLIWITDHTEPNKEFIFSKYIMIRSDIALLISTFDDVFL